MFVYVCFLLLFVFILKRAYFRGVAETVQASVILFSVFIVFLTETLSLFSTLNFLSLAISWAIFAIVFTVLILKDKKQLFLVFAYLKKTATRSLNSLKMVEKVLLFLVSVFLLCLLFQGLIYPPNNWDSLTYHLSRIMYWIGNESVAHFPTHILRHLYQPPFTEYFILHLNLLNGNDYFSNSVQWLFLVFTIVTLWLLLGLMNVSRFYKFLVAFLAVTLPAAELQASTTKNDIVCSFFVITAIYFCVKAIKENRFQYFILLGLSAGLAFLTKGTAYLFLVPAFLLFGFFIVRKNFVTNRFRIFSYAVLSGLLAVLINVGHYSRNYAINNSILNIDDAEAKAFANEDMNGKFFVSNVTKNVGLHIDYPYSLKYDVFIRNLHKNLAVDINSPLTNFNAVPYQSVPDIAPHEDLVPNFVHLLLIFCCFCFTIILIVRNRKNNTDVMLFSLVVIFQCILFALMLKWQPWHTRLQIPIFLLSTIWLCVVADRFKIFKYLLLLAVPLLCYTFMHNFIFNSTRPIRTKPNYTKRIKMSDSRFKKYFANQLYLSREYKETIDSFNAAKCHKVGLMLTDWEYPILADSYYDNIKIVAINVRNITKKIPQDNKNVDGIISNLSNSPFIMFEGNKYINENPNHQYLWFYKKSR